MEPQSIFLNKAMEYKPLLPQHNDNVSHDQPVREFVLLFSGITIFLLTVIWALSLLVDWAVETISPELEAKLFSSVAESFSDFEEGPRSTQSKIQGLVDGLKECAQIDYPLRVHLIESEDANALALPGGQIVIFSGLLDKIKSENGLTFVLAHELAHFKNRDHLRGLGRGIVLTTVLSMITGADSGITQLATPTVSFNQAQYSQGRETFADQSALQAMDCYYGHVGGSAEFFESMKSNDQKWIPLGSHYFASHPEVLQRIEHLRQQTNEQNFDHQGVLNELDFVHE